MQLAALGDLNLLARLEALLLGAIVVVADVDLDRVLATLDVDVKALVAGTISCLLYTSPSPRDGLLSRMPSSA